MNTTAYLSNVHVQQIWNRYTIDWDNINPDVNIVVGINGAGKTTLLNHIYKVCRGQCAAGGVEVLFVPSVDNIAIRDKRKKDTALTQMLKGLIQEDTSRLTLMQYRMQIIDKPEKAQIVSERIEMLMNLLNRMFQRSQKEFCFVNGSLAVKTAEDTLLPIDLLSSGEKHLLIIVLSIFLQEENNAIVLMDEPENTMHISWQRELIELLTLLNPNAQFIISTHSPSLFGAGWGDKVVYMENIMKLTK